MQLAPAPNNNSFSSFASANDEIENLTTRLLSFLEIDDTFKDALSEKNVALTPAGALLIVIPLFEEASDKDKAISDPTIMSNSNVLLEKSTVSNSLTSIIEGAKLNPVSSDTSLSASAMFAAENIQQRSFLSSFSVLKSIVARWCNIPPFCR